MESIQTLLLNKTELETSLQEISEESKNNELNEKTNESESWSIIAEINRERIYSLFKKVIFEKKERLMKICYKKIEFDNARAISVFHKINKSFSIFYPTWRNQFGGSNEFDEAFMEEWSNELMFYNDESIDDAIRKIRSGGTDYNKFPPTLMEFRKIIDEVAKEDRKNKCYYSACGKEGEAKSFPALKIFEEIVFCKEHSIRVALANELAQVLDVLFSRKASCLKYQEYFLYFKEPAHDIEIVKQNISALFNHFSKSNYDNLDYQYIAQELIDECKKRDLIFSSGDSDIIKENVRKMIDKANRAAKLKEARAIDWSAE